MKEHIQDSQPNTVSLQEQSLCSLINQEFFRYIMCRYHHTGHSRLPALEVTWSFWAWRSGPLKLDSPIWNWQTSLWLHIPVLSKTPSSCLMSVCIASKSLSALVNKRTVWNVDKHQLFVLLEQNVARSASMLLNDSWAWANEISHGKPGSGYLTWDTETPLLGHQCETTCTDVAYQDRFGQSR